MLKFKYIYIFVLISVLSYSCCDCKKKSDEKKQIVPIVGQMTWETWKEKAGWKDFDAENYIIDKTKIQQIKTLVKKNNIHFVLVAANWCSDSEKEVPKFFKLIIDAEISFDKILLYGVDREKKEPTGETIPYMIERVPTLIILKDDKEIGRIVEYPVISWEEDILTILEGLK